MRPRIVEMTAWSSLGAPVRIAIDMNDVVLVVETELNVRRERPAPNSFGEFMEHATSGPAILSTGVIGTSVTLAAADATYSLAHVIDDVIRVWRHPDPPLVLAPMDTTKAAAAIAPAIVL